MKTQRLRIGKLVVDKAVGEPNRQGASKTHVTVLKTDQPKDEPKNVPVPEDIDVPPEEEEGAATLVSDGSEGQVDEEATESYMRAKATSSKSQRRRS